MQHEDPVGYLIGPNEEHVLKSFLAQVGVGGAQSRNMHGMVCWVVFPDTLAPRPLVLHKVAVDQATTYVAAAVRKIGLNSGNRSS